jgi:hypothetical protein
MVAKSSLLTTTAKDSGDGATRLSSFAILSTENPIFLNVPHTNARQESDRLIDIAVFLLGSSHVVFDQANQSIVVSKAALSAEAIIETLVNLLDGQLADYASGGRIANTEFLGACGRNFRLMIYTQIV